MGHRRLAEGSATIFRSIHALCRMGDPPARELFLTSFVWVFSSSFAFLLPSRIQMEPLASARSNSSLLEQWFPPELVREVLQRCSVESLGRLAQTSQRYHHLATDNYVWRQIHPDPSNEQAKVVVPESQVRDRYFQHPPKPNSLLPYTLLVNSVLALLPGQRP